MRKQLLWFALGGILACSSCKKKDKEEKITGTDFSYNASTATMTIKEYGTDGVGTRTFGADTLYILDGPVYVNSGQTLTIEEGTIIKGKQTREGVVSALIVAKGGILIAEGSEINPIIFTSELDMLNGELAASEKGLWGGLVILGNASTSNSGEVSVNENLSADARSLYGGNNDNDNSGSLSYISVRHAGAKITDTDYFDGLTLCGVGLGTSMEYIEVAYSASSGIGLYGGMASIKNALVTSCSANAFNMSKGYRGYGQYWFAKQSAGMQDMLVCSGGNAQPATEPKIFNSTFIGLGIDAGKRLLSIENNSRGHFQNCIFANSATGADIEISDAASNSYLQALQGKVSVNHTLFSNVAETVNLQVLKDSISGSGMAVARQAVKDSAFNAAVPFAELQDTWYNTNGIDIISATAVIPNKNDVQNALAPTNIWFNQTVYQGAFDPESTTHWAQGWTLYFK